jgi:hypothetical protein
VTEANENQPEETQDNAGNSPEESSGLMTVAKWGVSLTLVVAVLIVGGYAFNKMNNKTEAAQAASLEGEEEAERKGNAASAASIDTNTEAKPKNHQMATAAPVDSGTPVEAPVADIRGDTRSLDADEVLMVSHFGEAKTPEQVHDILQKIVDPKATYLLEQFRNGVFEDPTQIIWFDYGFMNSELTKLGLDLNTFAKLRISRVNFNWKPGWLFRIEEGKNYFVDSLTVSVDDDGSISMIIIGAKRPEAPIIEKRCNGRFHLDAPIATE